MNDNFEDFIDDEENTKQASRYGRWAYGSSYSATYDNQDEDE